MSNIVTRAVGPKTAKTEIKHIISKKRPVFMWGPPGIGKSDIVHQIGVELNAHVIDVRLSLWDPTDIKGIPYFNTITSKMEWAQPAELPDETLASQHEKIILFLDELNSANPAVQAAAYQLILNRRVGTYVLPDNVYIIAAGNRDSDKGVTYKMPAPLANRFVHMDLEVNFEDWYSWAVKHKVHKDVVGFLHFSKRDLYNFDPLSPSKAFATPRSWAFVSELLDDELPESQMLDIVSGTIGEGLALKFGSHRKMASKLPKPEDILSGKVKELDERCEISAMYSFTTSLCYELQEIYSKGDSKFSQKFNNFLRFAMDNFDTELVVMGVKLAITQYQLPIEPDEIESFDEFHERFGKYIISSTVA